MTTLTLTITTNGGGVAQLQVSSSEMVQTLCFLVEVDIGIEASKQILTLNGNPLDPSKTLAACGVKDGDLIMAFERRPQQPSRPANPPAPGATSLPGLAVPSTGQTPPAPPDRLPTPQEAASYRGLRFADIPRGTPAVTLRNIIHSNPDTLLRQLESSNPDLAKAVKSGSMKEFRTVQLTQQMEQAEARMKAKDKEMELRRRLRDDPCNIELQKQLEDAINFKNVQQNHNLAMEHTPEVFSRVIMLYIDCEVQGVKLKAFVDSGAQQTIMSEECAKRCGLMRLVDKRFAGQAVGVGTAKIVGRVHLAQLKIGKSFFNCAFTVMANHENRAHNVGFLFGLDMLKRHQCMINLKTNSLHLEGAGGTEIVPFLSEREIPRNGFADSPRPASSSSPAKSTSTNPQKRSREPMDDEAAAASAVTATAPIPAPAPVSAPAPAPAPAPAASGASDPVAGLMALGFTREQVHEALTVCGGDPTLAASYLFQSNTL